MQLPHILHTAAAFFAYFSQVNMSHIFPHKMAFSTAISISFVFLLPISIWLPTEWHHPCVQTPVERDEVVGFTQFCAMFLLHI